MNNAESERSLPALLHPAIQNAMRLLSVFAIAAILVLAYGSDSLDVDHDADRPGGIRHVLQIDINEAGVQEWTLMPGIGTLTAQRILDDRKTKGPFLSLSDLNRVSGIGPKTIKEISPYCCVVSVATSPARKSLFAER